MEWQQRPENGNKMFNFQQIKERGQLLKQQIRSVLDHHSDAISAKDEFKASHNSRKQQNNFIIYLEIEKLRHVPNNSKGRRRQFFFVGKCPYQTFKTSPILSDSVYHHRWIESIPISLSTSDIEAMDNGMMILELWDKSQTSEDFIGMIKLPLHPFYLAYRTQSSACYRSHYPVVSAREFFELEHPLHVHERRGETLILFALGTNEQVHTFATHQRASRILQKSYRNYRSRKLSESKKKLKSLSMFLRQDHPEVRHRPKQKSKDPIVEFEVTIETLANAAKELKRYIYRYFIHNQVKN
jgi:hypothetical protein